MSIKITYDITRELAIKIILEKVDTTTNEELSEILESFEVSYFRNYNVMEQLPSEKYMFTIESIQQFNNEE